MKKDTEKERNGEQWEKVSTLVSFEVLVIFFFLR